MLRLAESASAAVPCDWKRHASRAAESTRTIFQGARQPSLRVRFLALADKWESETRFTSSLRDLISNDSYRKIIAMGAPVVPLLLSKIRDRPQGWFWALTAITGENPILGEHRGNITEMVRDWLNWGSQKGLIDEGER